MLIPWENERDLTEIPKNIKQNLSIRPVRWIDEVLDIALADHSEVLPAEPEGEPEEVTAEAPPADKPEKKKGVRVRTHH